MSKTIATILTLQDRFSPSLLRVNRNITGMSRQMRTASNQAARMASNFTKGIDKMANKVLKFGALAGIGGAALILKVGIEGLKELEEATMKVKSIAMAGLEVKNIKSGLLSASNKTGIGVTELADTQYNAISSGVSNEDSLKSALISAKLAKAGFTDANSSLKVMMATMNSYGLTGMDNMQMIADKMLVVQNAGVTTVAEMAEFMTSVNPIAAAAGASIDDLDAAMISLTKSGIKTDEAVTEMKGLFTSVISPTKESADAAKEFGIEFNAAALKSKGFSAFITDIRNKTGGSVEKMGRLFGNVRALTGALVLSGKGYEYFQDGLKQIQESADMTEKAFAIMENTIGSKWNKVKNRFKNGCTSIVDTQSGALGKLADSAITWMDNNQANVERWVNVLGENITKAIAVVKGIVDFLSAHKNIIAGFAVGFASFAFAIKVAMGLKVALGFLKLMFVGLSGAMAVTPFGWVVIAVTALTAGFVALYTKSSKFRNEVAFVFAKLQEFGNYVVTNLTPFLVNLGATIYNVVGGAFSKLSPVISNFVANVLMPVLTFLGGVFMAGFQVILPSIGNLFTIFVDVVSGTIANLIQMFTGIAQFVSGVFMLDWRTAWEGVTNIFGGIFNQIGTVASGVLNGIITSINTAIRGINSLSSTKLPAFMGGGNFGLKIPEIPMLAMGTQFAGGGPTLVGERGPEIVNLQKGNSVTTADKTSNILNSKGKEINISITIDSFIGEEYFADMIGERIAGKIKLALGNM